MAISRVRELGTDWPPEDFTLVLDALICERDHLFCEMEARDRDTDRHEALQRVDQILAIETTAQRSERARPIADGL